jgi:hypothetical protein
MPVALGTTRALAPLQTSELMNLGDSDLEYSIDIKPLSANSHRPDFFQNLYLENPKGVVAARSTHFLKWRFLPLEARQYTYELPIRYHTEEGRGDVSGLENTGSRRNSALIGRGVSPQSPTRKKLRQKSVLKIAGLGYDPREDDPHAEPPPHQNLGLVPPPYQLLSHQGVGILAQLSRERLALGRLPQRAKLRELLVLRNPSQLAAVEFAWEQTHPLISSGLLNISPSKGKILPGEFVSIKLSVDASCTPRVVETQITVRCKPAPLDEPKHRKSRGGGATSRSVTSLSRGGMMPSARSNNTRGGGGSVTSGGVDPMNNPSSSSLAPIVARSTKSRDAMLNDSSSQIMKLTGKQPKLPSRPPPPPRTGDNDEKSSTTGNNAINNTNSMNHNKMTQSQVQANNDDSQLLHLSIWFEVVDEEAYISLFQGDVSKIYVPRPRAFIPDDPAPEEYVFGKDGELSVITPQSNVGGVMSRLTNSPGYRKRGEEDKPNKKKVVPHTHHHRSHSEVATSVIESFFGDVFSDLLGRSEIQQSLMALPKQTKIPYFHDLREHANLMLRLAKAFRAFDLDGSGKLGIKEIKNAIVTMGLKAKTSEAKAFMRALDHDNDGEVDLKEFLAASMPPGVSLALDDAIDAIEHAAKEAKAEERRLARMWMAGQSGQGSAMRADIAALTIQANFRARKARKAAELRRELATNPDLQEQHEAASRLQGQLRGMKARIAAKERHARRLTVMRQVVLGDPDFQGLLTELVEDSISNLMNEVLHKEFDLGVPPKQYAFAASSSLAEEDD